MRKKYSILRPKKDDNGTSVIAVNILLAECIKDDEAKEFINYYPISLNLVDKMLIIRVRNWSNTIEEDITVDKMYKKIENQLKSIFSLTIVEMTAIAQEISYNLISYLVGSILNEPMKVVTQKLEQLIDVEVRKWAVIALKENQEITPSDYNVLKELILNNYCKYYLTNELKEVKAKHMKEKYGISGYPRYLRFIDDTVGEGEARAS